MGRKKICQDIIKYKKALSAKIAVVKKCREENSNNVFPWWLLSVTIL